LKLNKKLKSHSQHGQQGNFCWPLSWKGGSHNRYVDRGGVFFFIYLAFLSFRTLAVRINQEREAVADRYLLLLFLGAASGFGLATAKIFAAEGAKVVAVDLNRDSLAKVFSDASGSLVTLVADVTSLSDWERVLATAESNFGGLDILINNAGTSYRNKSTLEVTEAEFDRVMNVNLKSIYFSVQTIMPHMQKRGGGSIVNIASIGASRPRPGLIWYNASKSAVVNVSFRVFPPFFLLLSTFTVTNDKGADKSID
jgi:SAM-dependent methyltransferase